MPLVRIDSPAATPEQLDALGQAVHDALIEAFAISTDDRFQILRGGSPDRIVYDSNYLGIQRDEHIAFVQVFLRAGRTPERKQVFYRVLAEHAEAAGIAPGNLFVTLTENADADWSFGNGIAQYLTN